MDQRESFGAYLKSHREKKGIRLEEIASITKIHLRSLEHLEAGHWKQLPPDPFLRGFIVAYAKYIGLDQKEAVDRFLEEWHPQQTSANSGNTNGETEKSSQLLDMRSRPRATPSMVPPSELKEQSKTFPFKKFFIGAGLVTAVSLFLIIMKVGQEAKIASLTPVTAPAASEETVASTPATELPTLPGSTDTVKTSPSEEPRTVAAQPTTESPAVTTPAVNTENKMPAPGDAAHELVIEGKERTWIKVVFDKEPPTEYFLPEGDKVTYRAKEKIKIVLGNSTGTKVIHNGSAVPGVKLQGTIRQYIFPSDARFPQDAASRRAASSQFVDGTKVTPETKSEAVPAQSDE